MKEYGFSSNINGYKTLLEIFDILDDKIEIIDKILILPNNYEELIGNRQLKLTKKFYTYKNNLFNKAYTVDEYYQIQEEAKRKLLEEQKRKEKKLFEEQLIIKELEKLKLQFGNKWRDKAWIEKHIGEYYSYEPCMEYYWTIIGEDFKYSKGGNIILENKIYQCILNDKSFNIKGSQFLGRRFKKYGSKSILSETYFKEEIVTSCGVYGIYINDELLYIGSTMRNFKTRFEEHINNINSRNNSLYVYSLIKDNDEIKFKVLIDIMQLKTNIPITRKDVESMELALIHVNHPKGNLADGVKYEFKYREV